MTNTSFTDSECQVLLAALECYMEGFEDATNDVIRDRSHDTPEQLLEAITGMHEDYAAAQTALHKLRRTVREVAS